MLIQLFSCISTCNPLLVTPVSHIPHKSKVVQQSMEWLQWKRLRGLWKSRRFRYQCSVFALVSISLTQVVDPRRNFSFPRCLYIRSLFLALIFAFAFLPSIDMNFAELLVLCIVLLDKKTIQRFETCSAGDNSFLERVLMIAQREEGISVFGLGAIDTTYLSFYAIGQFLNGAIGDRIGSR